MAKGEKGMKNGKFEVGTVIKGKNLKGKILCKILSEDMKMRGFQYKIGLNEDVKPLSLTGNCETGLHFCFIKDIWHFLYFGSELAIVSVPDEEDIYVGEGKFRTHRLNIEQTMPYAAVSTWEYLYKNVAKKSALSFFAIKYAIENGNLELVKYLHKNWIDIQNEDNYSVKYAAQQTLRQIIIVQ